jgi:hypothetical protein
MQGTTSCNDAKCLHTATFGYMRLSDVVYKPTLTDQTNHPRRCLARELPPARITHRFLHITIKLFRMVASRRVEHGSGVSKRTA